MFCSRCGTQVDTSSRFCPSCGLDLSSITGTGKAGATAPLAAQPPQEDEVAIVREALKDEYELEKELGRGGMAVVFKARDKQLEREVAIKVLPFSLSFDAEFVERFQREARTAGKLEHPNIIPIYRVGRSGRVIYFVMKFIRGKSLSSVIEAHGAIPIPELKRLLIECTRALGYAHKHGIVHRDIKPDNIMFDELGQAIVTDFGIAKAQSGARLTGTGMSIGTPHYMSPEQARAQNLDGRSDIYSLGVVSYQCLTGHVPFDGEDSFSIGYKHIMEELPVPPLEQADQREMFGVIQRMMAKKPDDRFQNAEELVAALEGGAISAFDMSTMPTRAIEPQKPPVKAAAPPLITSAPTTPLPRASASMGKPKDAAPAPPAPPAAAPLKPSFKPKEVTPKRSNKGLIAALAVLGLVGAGLGGYVLFFGKKNPEPTQQVVTNPPVTPPPIAGDSSHDTTKASDTAKQPDTASAKAEPTSKREPTAKREPPPANTRNQPAGEGTISLSGQIPRGATIKVDGRAERSNRNRFKVPAGSHTIEIVAQGFQIYTRSVTVAPGKTEPVPVTLTPTAVAANPPGNANQPNNAQPAADCNSATVGKTNRNHECYDERPVPQTQATVTPPASCTGRVTPTNLLVNISAEGEVVGNPQVIQRSNCAEFDNLARVQIQEISFRPAKKNGRAVPAWIIQPMSPSRP